MKEMLDDYLADAAARLALLRPHLSRLENDPADRRLLNILAQGLRRVRAGCGFFDLARVSRLAAQGETLLDEICKRGEAAPGEIERAQAIIAKLVEVIAYAAHFGREPPGDETAPPEAFKPRPMAGRDPGPAPPDAPATPAEGLVAAPERRRLTLRVPVAHIDQMLGIASELVLIRDALTIPDGGKPAADAEAALRRLTRAAGELHRAAVQARMQPFGRIAEQLSHFAQALGRERGKAITVAVEGAAVSVDLATGEAMHGPLTELVRNAVTHGIETADERRALGKSALGRITLTASVDADRLCVCVGDDGRGGVEPGAPGGGWANIRAALAMLDGGVAIADTPGSGARVTLTVAQALSIVPALLLKVGGESYALAQSQVVDVMEAGGGRACELARVGDRWVCHAGGEVLPLVDLAAHFQVAPVGDPPRARMVVRLGAGFVFGLLADEVAPLAEAVVRPLPALPCGAPGLAGAVLRADGGVSLLLDIRNLAACLNLPPSGLAPQAAPRPTHAPALFMCRDAAGSLIALPFSSVHRVATPASGLVHSPGKADAAFRFGNRLLPLIGADGLPPRRDWQEAGTGNVLLIGGQGAAFAMAVGDLHDPLATLPLLGRPGAGPILGGFVHDGESASVLDLGYLVRQAGLSQRALGAPAAAKRVALLVDAQPVTRDMLVLTLGALGFETLAAADFTAARRLLAGQPACAVLVVDLGQALADAEGWLATRRAAGEAGRRALGLCAAPSAATATLGRRIGIKKIAGKFDRRAIGQALTRQASAGQALARHAPASAEIAA